MKIKLLLGLLLSCLTAAIYGQHTVTGKVIDQKGDPMIETTVIEKGTTNGTTTDLDGNYTLEVSSPDASLHISFVGYEEKTIPIEGRTEINVTLKEKTEELDEVIVVGYGIEKKQDLSGSIELVESKEIENVPIMSSEEVLQGKASGVFVAASSGAPGAPISVRIR
ncbi:MAG: carboxypeptidase-like regulatory domain-containing protein, partial [Bacteroidota bacterium]